MRILIGSIVSFFLCSIIPISCTQKKDLTYTKEKKEIESFMSNYQRLLQNAKFDSVALLYVDTGFVSLGNGQIEVEAIDSIKSGYARMAKILNDFHWENTRIEILNTNAAFVTSVFYWHDKNSFDTTKKSYTGIFVKPGNSWKIIHEHESLDMMAMYKIIKASENNVK